MRKDAVIVEIGQRFGKVVVISNSEKQFYLKCICDCGQIFNVKKYSLVTGNTKSCGCYKKEKVTIHGLTSHALYQNWADMKVRCYNSNHHNYHNYGGRGISVCSEWRNDFKAFYDWAIANGWEEGLQIDRINNDGNYEPTNCRWTDAKINSRNSRQTKLSIEKAEEIRGLYNLGSFSYREIGLKYGVGKDCIGAIIRLETWI